MILLYLPEDRILEPPINNRAGRTSLAPNSLLLTDSNSNSNNNVNNNTNSNNNANNTSTASSNSKNYNSSRDM